MKSLIPTKLYAGYKASYTKDYKVRYKCLDTKSNTKWRKGPAIYCIQSGISLSILLVCLNITLSSYSLHDA